MTHWPWEGMPKSGSGLYSLLEPVKGSLGGAAVWRLPLAQGAILETRDRIPHWAPGAWSLLLPLPVSLRLSLSLSLFPSHPSKKRQHNLSLFVTIINIQNASIVSTEILSLSLSI